MRMQIAGNPEEIDLWMLVLYQVNFQTDTELSIHIKYLSDYKAILIQLGVIPVKPVNHHITYHHPALLRNCRCRNIGLSP